MGDTKLDVLGWRAIAIIAMDHPDDYQSLVREAFVMWMFREPEKDLVDELVERAKEVAARHGLVTA